MWKEIALINEIPIGERKLTEIDGTPIVVFNLNGMYYTIEDNCPHQHLPLGDGIVNGDRITCPFHGAEFCIKTGKVTNPPAVEDIMSYPTKVDGDKILVYYGTD
jgi:3-phenylpropionate/trans-cinnamate dioxygenase ferredoxin component